MFRAKLTNDTNARVRMVTLAGTGGQTISMGTSAADGTTFCVRTGATQVDGTNLTVGDWNWFTLVRATDVSSGYLNGVLDASHTVAASWTPAGIYLFSATIDGLDGCIEGFKFWDAALTATEIQAEMASLAPIRTANLNRWTPLVPYGSGTRNLDRSGNGYDWTEVGTLTDESGSGTPWQAVITAAAGVATASTLAGSSTAQSTVTAAAGATTASTLTGSSTAAASVTPAAGVSTAGTLTGQAVTSAAITPADGSTVAGTLTGSSTAQAGVTAAAGVVTTQSLAGSSTAEGAITPAQGVATGETLTGVGQEGSTINPAAGVGTGETLAGSSIAVASIVPAEGSSSTETLQSNGQDDGQTDPGWIGPGPFADPPSRAEVDRIRRKLGILPPKVRKVIKRLARQEAKQRKEEEHIEPSRVDVLRRQLEREQIAWQQFYAELLADLKRQYILESIGWRLQALEMERMVSEQEAAEVMEVLEALAALDL